MRLLIVEDEKELRRSILEYFNNSGVDCESAIDYESALDKFELYDYDCILLDLNLPGGSGLDLLRILKRQKPDSAVIIVSANDSLDQKLQGLDWGADDYLTKPFHLSELSARINSVLRRKSGSGSNRLVFEDLVIELSEMVVYVKDEEVNLTKKEFDILLYLVHNKNKVITKVALAEHIWGEYADSSYSYDYLYSHIKNLRKKLVDAGSTDHIKTVYGVGYKFKA
ncbi:MAG: response regulator transcription factor [Flavobacteriales bacterium]|nr:response regulator transcription factor [Flavobacteriales bacterium]